MEAQDEIRRKYGSRALTRARLLGDPLADPGGRDPLQPLEGRRVGRARPGARGAGDAGDAGDAGGAGDAGDAGGAEDAGDAGDAGRDNPPDEGNGPER